MFNTIQLIRSNRGVSFGALLVGIGVLLGLFGLFRGSQLDTSDAVQLQPNATVASASYDNVDSCKEATADPRTRSEVAAFVQSSTKSHNANGMTATQSIPVGNGNYTAVVTYTDHSTVVVPACMFVVTVDGERADRHIEYHKNGTRQPLGTICYSVVPPVLFSGSAGQELQVDCAGVTFD